MLTWDHVLAYRVQQHHLDQPADDLLQVVSHLMGAQAQLMPAAELALSARVRDLTAEQVQNALWQERTLVKSWFLRGTLHLITAADFPLYTGILNTLRHFRRKSWFKYFGVTEAQLDALLAGIQAVLSETPLTREQLADALVAQTGEPALRDLLLSGWGALLKPASFQGYLCFGPSDGQHVTFVSPKKWLKDSNPLPSEAASREVARRFLRTYAPATIEEFARWIGLEPSAARKIFKALGDEITPVEVEGWSGYVLTAALETMQSITPTPSVRLLGHFDPYTIAVAPHADYVLPENRKGRVYRPQGWIAPVVLVNGRIAGTWEQDKQRKQPILCVEMFASPSKAVQQGIAAEVERINRFTGIEAKLVYEE